MKRYAGRSVRPRRQKRKARRMRATGSDSRDSGLECESECDAEDRREESRGQPSAPSQTDAVGNAEEMEGYEAPINEPVLTSNSLEDIREHLESLEPDANWAEEATTLLNNRAQALATFSGGLPFRQCHICQYWLVNRCCSWCHESVCSQHCLILHRDPEPALYDEARDNPRRSHYAGSTLIICALCSRHHWEELVRVWLPHCLVAPPGVRGHASFFGY
eukprot:6492465-Amphidinium_carterae.2